MRYFLALSFFAFLSAFSASGQISGPSTVNEGATETYSYTTMFVVVPEWSVTNGTVASSWVTGNTYYASVNWTTTGSGQVRFMDGDGELANLNVTVDPPLPGAPTGVPGSRCGTGTVALSATPVNGNTIKWYSASSGGAALTTSLNYTTPSISVTTSYYITSYNSTTTIESSPRTQITATVNTVPGAPTSPVGDTRCGSGSVTLSASVGSNGTTLRWYSASSGGSPLHTGTSYTPSVVGTLTFYAGSYNAITQCESSSRTAVTATVISLPGLPEAENVSRCGSGTVTLTSTLGDGGTSVRWYSASSAGTLLQTDTSYTTGSLSSTTSYWITTYNSTTGCESHPRIEVQAVVEALPSAPGVGGPYSRFGFGPISLVASGAAGQQTYQWMTNAGADISGATSATYTPQFITTTSYKVRLVSATGCSGTSTSVTGTVNPFPVVTTSGDPYLGLSQTVTLDVQDVYTTYQWKKNGVTISGATTDSYVADEAGRYSVVVTLSSVTMESDYLYVAMLSNAPESASPSYDNNTPASVGSATRKNYVRSYSAKEPELEESDFTYSNFDSSQVSMTTQYLDGLGLAVQTVSRQASPQGKDVVSYQEYDSYGRIAKEYLPYSTSTTDIDTDGFRKNAKLEQYNFYRNGTTGVAQTGVSFTQTAFESSPLNREQKKAGTGEDWKMGSGHEVKFDSRVLGVQDAVVRYFLVNTSGELVQNGIYNPGELLVAEVRDENDQVTREYKDKQGRPMLKRVKGDEDEWLDTYYVYDAPGNLRFVLPPQLVKELGANTFVWATHNSLVSNLGYQYQYDARQRVIEKRVPGAGWVYMVYDKLDRVVLTQDANQRAEKKWSFTKYDHLNRPVMNGLYTHSDSIGREAMSALISTTEFAETYTGSGHGYSTTVFPTTNLTVHTVTYYDTYAFRDDLAGSSYNFVNNHLTGQTIAYFKRVNGLVTGTRTNILSTNDYLWAVNYYDSRHRVIQAVVQNHLDSLDRITTIYDFTGQVLKTKTTHCTATESTDITRTLEYDHADRLVNTYHRINSEDSVLLSQNEYNELSQLITKKLHSEDTDPFRQTIDYSYNIKGWLTASAGEYFTFDLYYNTGFNNALHNGNISGMTWFSPLENKNSSAGFTYDNLNRLKQSNYAVMNNGTDEWTEQEGHYNEKLSYDGNGNILTLERTGKKDNQTMGEIDDLAYTYTGNQLLKVDDASAQLAGFSDGNTSGDDYEYDANGSMTRDKNKGITSITYNHLNLPATVRKSGADSIVYTYDATGRKLRQQVYGITSKITDYAGEFIYENDTLRFINHEEGRVIPEGYEYQYHLKDHLGNVRMTFTSKQKADTALATLETANVSDEEGEFIYYDEAVRINSALFDHTNQGGTYYSTRLNGSVNEQHGLAKSISVMPGDTVRAEVYAKYLDPDDNNWTTALTNFMAAISGGSAPPGTVVDGGASGSTGGQTAPFLSFLNKEEETGSDPKAYLNYLVFDRDYNLLDGGFVRMTDAAREYGQDGAHELLAAELAITEAGYVYIYLSNDNADLGDAQVEVYFDDFRVRHVKSPVVQMDDYYPFGLTFNSYSRENSVPNKIKFQGQEHIDDLGLGWVSFKWRNHQPDIGRFFNIDPIAEKYLYNSPYAFSENKVTSHVELEGLEAENFMSKFKKPSELAVKPVPSGEGVQHQSYSVVVQNGKKDVSDLRSAFKDKPQDILNNSKADFQPVDGDGNPVEHANLQEGSFIEIGIPGPLNNSTVKVTGETSDANGFSMTFSTLEGHVEAGQITFSATQGKDGSVTFSINSTSKVDSGYTKMFAEGTAREKQAESWQEVLTNVVNYLQGTEASRTTTKKEDEKK